MKRLKRGNERRRQGDRRNQTVGFWRDELERRGVSSRRKSTLERRKGISERRKHTMALAQQWAGPQGTGER